MVVRCNVQNGAIANSYWDTQDKKYVVQGYSHQRQAYSSLRIIPYIYVKSDILVRYNETEKKYYTDLLVETDYSNYGSHTTNFNIGVKVTSESSINAIISFFADSIATPIKTASLSTTNEFVSFSIPLNDLTLGKHQIKVQVTVGGASDVAYATVTKIANEIPSILTNEIGNVAQPFTTTYQVYDDDGDSLNVKVKLDGAQIDSKTDVSQHTDIPLSVSSANFNALTYGNHSITIEATDGTNTSTSTIAFIKNSIPTVSLAVHDLGEVLQPTSVNVNYDSADGGAMVIKAYIDGKEIET